MMQMIWSYRENEYTEQCIVVMEVKIIYKDRKIRKGLVNCLGGFNYISFAFFISFVFVFFPLWLTNFHSFPHPI